MTTYRSYTAMAGETWDFLALCAYDDEALASVLIEANPRYCDVLIFEGGELIRIPNIEPVAVSESIPPWRAAQ